MEQELLPIGTVVTTKGSNVELMIIGYKMVIIINGKEEMYDYSTVRLEEGFKSIRSLVLFNKDKIDNIISYGYQDEDFSKFMFRLKGDR